MPQNNVNTVPTMQGEHAKPAAVCWSAQSLRSLSIAALFGQCPLTAHFFEDHGIPADCTLTLAQWVNHYNATADPDEQFDYDQLAAENGPDSWRVPADASRSPTDNRCRLTRAEPDLCRLPGGTP